MTVVRKDLINKIVVNHRTNFINHLYSILLEIQELNPQSKKYKKKTQIVNIYNNQNAKGNI